ncbi:hypothetical protein [Halalkalibacter sp. APA_J-10(15)]|uniref:hypothetical protein n=1 Tax=Halalkalibacter sp. APA_J-10(15) TaxID=2933805 RepID=UPI001FF66EAD|nr:hypothetical protein [Halalkalibacter sp. APA_J-10(15)]MCK0472532.1 hypothetical protein [Halalkalibacter sp. APA_J-10(15)]
MISLISFIGAAAFSFFLFKQVRWVVYNYQGKKIPYSIGCFLMISYVISLVLLQGNVRAGMGISLIYLFVIWGMGLLDDIYGEGYPKGLKGHFRYFREEHRLTTGLMKGMMTVVVAALVVWQWQQLWYEAFIAFWLLVSFPHVMNLFDTRPLRVLKVTTIIAGILLLGLPFDFSLMRMVGIVTLIWLLMEGSKWAMLGDNGSTLVGAMIALVVIHFSSLSAQFIMSMTTAFFIWYAERVSFSAVIEKVRVLKALDQLGIKKG